MTKRTLLIAPTAWLALLTLTAAPSFAQPRDRAPEARPSSAQTQERAQPRSEAPRAQPQAPPRQAPTPPPQQPQRAQAEAQRPQAGAAPSVAPRQQTRSIQQPVPVPRAQQPAQAPRADSRSFDSRANDSRRVEGRRDDIRGGVEVGRAVPRGSVAPSYAPHYSSPRVYAPRSYYRPYVFRPRYSIGFGGIYLGYAVPYTYSYPYPIEVYGYGAPSNEVMITPDTTAYGGVALDITPADAEVYVDGEYAGHVGDFDGTNQPLTLTPGTHRLEVRAQGYEPMSVDVGVQAGQVIPYRGDLRPY